MLPEAREGGEGRGQEGGLAAGAGRGGARPMGSVGLCVDTFKVAQSKVAGSCHFTHSTQCSAGLDTPLHPPTHLFAPATHD